MIIIPVLCRPVHNWRWLKALADVKNNPREDEDTNQSGREYRTRARSCFLGYNDGSSGFEQFLYCKVGALFNFRAWVFSTSPYLERVGTTVYRLNPIRKRINREYLFHKAPDLDCLVSRTVWSNRSPGARVYMSLAVSEEFYPHTLCYSSLLRTSRGEYYQLCCTDKKAKVQEVLRQILFPNLGSSAFMAVVCYPPLFTSWWLTPQPLSPTTQSSPTQCVSC